MLKVVVVGLGPIGFACARAVRAERGIKLVGLVDQDPQKHGKTLAELTKATIAEDASDQDSEPRVMGRIADAVGTGADVAVMATTCYLPEAMPVLRRLLQHRLAVISSCEELSWPWYRHPDLARQLDAEATAAGRAVLGTGVNPGFIMDKLPIVLGTMVRRVTQVRCVRRVEASTRRRPLQVAIGAGLSREVFDAGVADGTLGHKGLAESAAMLAAGLGRVVEPGSVQESIEPVMATEPVPSALGLIQPGQVAGVHQAARWSGAGLAIDLDLTMAISLDDPRDTIAIDGPVQLRCKIPGGIPGDSATVAALLNYIPAVHAARPGLRSMLDVPAAGCHNLDFPLPRL